ncbi:MAG: ATP-dependent Clp protease adaptor ClpS [Bacteroidota bacterium]
MDVYANVKELILEQEQLATSGEGFQIILWNDEVNTFSWVIESLCEILEHNTIQAEQCTMIVHHNGKTSVKVGSYDYLRPRYEALQARGLTVTIEQTA